MSTKHDLRKRGPNDEGSDTASKTGQAERTTMNPMGGVKNASVGATTGATPGTADSTDRPQATGAVSTGAPSTPGKGAGMPQLPDDSTMDEQELNDEELDTASEEEAAADDEGGEEETPNGRYNA